MTPDVMDHLPPSAAPLDQEALARLVTLAGPRDAPELMQRLTADLRTIAAGLQASLVPPDRKTLRQHCHNLLAIAGTINAQPIYQLAKALNQPDGAPETATWPDTVAQVVELNGQLSGLIAHLLRLSDQMGMA